MVGASPEIDSRVRALSAAESEKFGQDEWSIDAQIN